MKLSLLAMLLAQSFAADFDRNDRGDRPPRCNQEKINGCKAESANLYQAEIEIIADIDDKLTLCTADLSTIESRDEKWEKEDRGEEISFAMVTREKNFSKKISSEKEIFPGGPGPSAIFFGQKLPLAWEERSPEVRQDRLTKLADQISERRANIGNIRQKLAMQINALKQTKEALRAQKAIHSENARLHDNEYQSGCQARYCSQN